MTTLCRIVFATFVLTLALGAGFAVAAAPATPPAPAAAGSPAEAAPVLVIIDIQQFYFAGGQLPLTGPVEASEQAKKLLQFFRQKGWPVVHVRHLPASIERPDTPGLPAAYAIHPNVAPLAGEPIVGKHHANAFRDTNLQQVLAGLHAKRLVIVGMQTHMCVEAASRAAADLGYDVTVVHDACATRPLSFGGTEIPAAQVHATALAAITTGGYDRAVSTDEFIKSVK